MKETRSYFGNVYYLHNGKEWIKQVFGKQHYEIIVKATRLSKTLTVVRLMLVSMYYNKNLENYMNVHEHFKFKDGKFILESKCKDKVL